MHIKINEGTLDDIIYPEVLYKYRSWSNPYHKRFIAKREVFMASPNQFEDKQDCKIPVRYDLMNKVQAEKFYDRLSKLAEPQLSRQVRRREVRKRVKAKEYLDPDQNEIYRNLYFDQYFSRIGILSLTAENCLSAMWKKYADDHRGFCIAYNSRILFEYLGGGGKVQYCENLPILLPDPIMDREEIRYKQVYFKDNKWEFEKEYRTQKFWVKGATETERRISIPKEAFHSVTLGKNMNEKDKREIVSEIHDSLGNIPVVEYKEVCS